LDIKKLKMMEKCIFIIISDRNAIYNLGVVSIKLENRKPKKLLQN